MPLCYQAISSRLSYITIYRSKLAPYNGGQIASSEVQASTFEQLGSPSNQGLSMLKRNLLDEEG